MTAPEELLSHREAAEAIQPYLAASAHWWLTDSRKQALGFRRGPLPPAVAERRGGRVFYHRREIDRVIRELTIAAVIPSVPSPMSTSISSGVVVPAVDDGEPAVQFRTDDGTVIVMRCADARAFIGNVIPAIRMAEAWAASAPRPAAA